MYEALKPLQGVGGGGRQATPPRPRTTRRQSERARATTIQSKQAREPLLRCVSNKKEPDKKKTDRGVAVARRGRAVTVMINGSRQASTEEIN
jgi:hypothetical protein